MPKIREINQMPPEAEGGAEEQLAALRDYLVKTMQELCYLLTHLDTANIDEIVQRLSALIPSKYTGTPSADGEASAGNTGKWADGGHVHPTDTSRAAADIEINGHALTDDITLDASDVGAVPSTDKGAAGGVASLDSGGKVPSAQLPAYPVVPGAYTSNPNMDGTASPGSTGKWADGGHVHPSDTSRVPTSRTINGYDLTQDRTLTAADVGAAPAKSALRFTSVAVSAGTSQQIISISNADITTDHVLARIEWTNPSYITAGYTWTTATGSFTLSGTCTAATTANVLLVRKGN